MDFNSFSKKQITALSWWYDPFLLRRYDALICDGAIRSGKTLCMGISFVAWAMKNFDSSSFAICGKTLGAIKRNLIDPILPVLTDVGFSCRFKIGDEFKTNFIFSPAKTKLVLLLFRVSLYPVSSLTKSL